MTEEQRLDDAGSLSDFSSSGAAVVLACEEIAGGVEQESPDLASGTTRRPGRCPYCGLVLGRRSLGHDHSLFQPMLGSQWIWIVYAI